MGHLNGAVSKSLQSDGELAAARLCGASCAPVLELAANEKANWRVRGCGKTREQTAPWRDAAPYLVARKFSANRAIAMMPRFREFFSSLVEPAALIHAR